ncbi:MAG: hypothetical protein Q8P41_26730 [Pseudomonadota bacterium]|nr:hypothetical protein [Pseudomonadota bacterium]
MLTLPLPVLLAGNSADHPVDAPLCDGAGLRVGFAGPGPFRALRDAALPALAMTPFELVVVEADVLRPGGLRIASISRGTHVAEQILSPETMRRVQRLLSAERLLVAVPSRGRLVATDPVLPEERIAEAHRFVQSVFDEAGPDALSPAWFVVVDGVLSGVEPARPIPPPPSPPAGAAGGKTARIRVSGSDFRQLGGAITEKLPAYMRQVQGRLDLDVQIEGHLDEAPALAPELRRVTERFAASGEALATIGTIRVTTSAPARTDALSPLSSHQALAVALAPYAILMLAAVPDALEAGDGRALEEGLLDLTSALIATSDPVLQAATRYLQAEPPEALARLVDGGRSPRATLQAAGHVLRIALPPAQAEASAEALIRIARRVAPGREELVTDMLGSMAPPAARLAESTP